MPLDPLSWPLPQKGETAAFSHLSRTAVPVDPHSHRDHQLLVPMRGRPVLTWAGGAVRLARPGAVLVAAGTRHSLACPEGAIELATLQVHPRALGEAARLAGAGEPVRAGEVIRIARLPPMLTELVFELLAHRDAVDAGSELPPVGRLAYPYLCLALVDRIARERVERGPTGNVLEAKTFSSEHVERAVHWMQAHLGESLRLSELARRIGTSPRHLTREFTRELGIAPARYLTRLRIDAAARRLVQTRDPVKVIAAEVGYASVPRFNHAFREVTGKTPLEVRKAGGR